jgi:hypothetical protein
VPYCIGEELPGSLFGPDRGLRLNRPDDGLMMHEYIEQAFGNGNITIFPVDTGTRPVLRWKIPFMNQDARNQRLPLGTVKTIGELDGKEIIFRTDQRPASRFLYYHFVVSLLHANSRTLSARINALAIIFVICLLSSFQLLLLSFALVVIFVPVRRTS